MKRYYLTVHCAVGELFGLKAADLTLEQLRAVSTPKLLELLPSDLRIEEVLAERILTDTAAEHSSKLVCFEPADWIQYAKITTAYNAILTATNLFASITSYYNRGNFVFWDALNESNRLAELYRYLDDQVSVFQHRGLDCAWINSLDLPIQRSVAEHGLNCTISSVVNAIIVNLNAELLPEFLPRILTLNNDAKLHLLYNPATPSHCLPELLRLYSKRQAHLVSAIKCPLTTSTILELPTVMRLQVLENLVHNTYKRAQLQATLPDVHTEQDFHDYLFSALTRYSDRVSDLVSDFTRRFHTD